MYVSVQFKQAQVRQKCNAQSDDSVEKWFLWYKPPPPPAPKNGCCKENA